MHSVKTAALALAALLASSMVIGKASAMPANALAAAAKEVTGVQDVYWVCGPYRCWWAPGPYWRGPYWGYSYSYWGPYYPYWGYSYWGPRPYYWGWRRYW